MRSCGDILRAAIEGLRYKPGEVTRELRHNVTETECASLYSRGVLPGYIYYEEGLYICRFILATLIPLNNMPVCSNVQSIRNEQHCSCFI